MSDADKPNLPRVPTPRGLQVDGRRLWKKVTKAYLLRPDELVLLETACKTADMIAAMEAAMIGQPLVVLGSMGQQREHPLLSEMRQQRGLLGRTLAQLKLPDEDGGQAWGEQRSSQARAAANARWDRPTAGAGPWSPSR